MFITNYRRFGIFEVSWDYRGHRPVLKDTWQAYEFMKGILIKCR